MPDIDAKKIEELRGFLAQKPVAESEVLLHYFHFREALPALLDLAERASLPLAGDVDALCKALLSYQQADADGVMVTVSRQACDEAASLISSLAGRVEAERRAKEEAEAENARLARLVYVPGQWRCAKCKFTLIQANLNANDGTVTARDQPGDKCPNCDSPLWRVTERDAGNEMIDRAEEAFEAKRAAEARSAALARALERIATALTAEKWARARLKYRIDLRMNDHLVEMREGHDDSISGFNEAWDIVRSVFADMESDNAGK